MNKNILIFFKTISFLGYLQDFSILTDPVLLVFQIYHNSTLYMVNTDLRDMHSGLKKYHHIILHVHNLEQTNSTT